MTKFVFGGKERKFKKVKIGKLVNFEEEYVKKLEKAKNQREVMLATGEMVAELIEPFEPEEIFELEQDEYYLAQALHLLQPYYKQKRSKAEIEDIKKRIIDMAINSQLDLVNPSFQF